MFFAICSQPFAQVSIEAFPMNPQTGQYNYFGVRVTLSETNSSDITIEGIIQEEDNPGSKQSFSLTVLAGSLTAETSANFFTACPACGAETELGSIITSYAGVPIAYQANECILKFNSISDINTVIDQLFADDESYNDDYDSQYPNLTEDQLDEMDEQNSFDEFKIYRDFENLFGGFCSARSMIENTETAWLENNFNGTDPDDIDLTFDDALNTIFNNTYSFMIGNDVYQLTNLGMYKNGVYEETNSTSGIINKSYDNMYLTSSLNYVSRYSGPIASIVENLQKEADFVQGLFPFSVMTDCKSNKRSKIFQEYDNGNKRIKLKVSITSVVIRSGVGSKLVNYKKKNGKWKRKRAEMAVGCAGTYYTNLCADSHQFIDRKPINGFKKRKQLATRRHSPAHIPEQGTVWKTYSDMIQASVDIPNQVNGTLLLTF